MSYYYLLYSELATVCVLLLATFSICQGSPEFNETCGTPPALEEAQVIHGVLESGVYPPGHQIVYLCEHSMGHRMVSCLKDHNHGDSATAAEASARWSEPENPCTAQPPLGAGTAVGLVMAIINYIIGLSAIWYASRRHKRKQVEDAIMEAADMMPVL